MRAMLHYVTNGVLLAVHTDTPPSEKEWNAYMLDAVTAQRGNLVVTDGGGPNARQRAMISDNPAIAGVPTAILTPSVVARGIVTAIRWLGKNIQAFKPEELASAFRYLSIQSTFERDDLMKQIADMKVRLAGGESIHTLSRAARELRDVEQATEYVLTATIKTIRGRLTRERSATSP